MSLTGQVSYMIHSARPTVLPVVNIVFCFVRTDNMCENNDPYRPSLWVGRVDQLFSKASAALNGNPVLIIKFDFSRLPLCKRAVLVVNKRNVTR